MYILDLLFTGKNNNSWLNRVHIYLTKKLIKKKLYLIEKGDWKTQRTVAVHI